MTERRNILAVYAHPDDEILGAGGTMALYANRGVANQDVRVELVCATRGEAGEISDPALATRETLPQVREEELRCSAERLGISKVTFLGFRDSGMAGTEDNEHAEALAVAPAEAVVPKLVEIVRRVRPDVILTFEPYGGYGHPDHVAIHRHTLAAYEAAADADYRPELGQAWQTPRLFYPVVISAMFEELVRRLEARGADVSEFKQRLEEGRDKRWPKEKVTVTMDVTATVDRKIAAFHCHRTQFGADNLFLKLPEAELKTLLSTEYFYLARPETNLMLDGLFDGLGIGD
ncbi:MAG TPA: PIG-L family deacetylase [Anaerolineae bacterium]